MHVYTLGYGRWPANERLQRIVDTLRAADVELLVDIRHSPCPSNVNPQSSYGPRVWHLLRNGEGLDGHLRRAGIHYEWLVELGNPQKRDPSMRILRSHIAEPDGNWPVNRGLKRLCELIKTRGRVCALLCACKKYATCHRKLIAEELSRRSFAGRLSIQDLN